MKIDTQLSPNDLLTSIQTFWDLSAQKIDAIEKDHTPEQGSPVFTIQGKYVSQAWTEWTQGFQFGSPLR